jgi:hypothetical protein
MSKIRRSALRVSRSARMASSTWPARDTIASRRSRQRANRWPVGLCRFSPGKFGRPWAISVDAQSPHSSPGLAGAYKSLAVEVVQDERRNFVGMVAGKHVVGVVQD